MPVADYTHLLPTFEPVPSSRTNMGKRLAAIDHDRKEAAVTEYSPFSHRSAWIHESAMYQEMPSADRYDRVAAQGDGPAPSGGDSGSGRRGSGFAGTGRHPGGEPAAAAPTPTPTPNQAPAGDGRKPVPEYISKKAYGRGLRAHAATGIAAGTGLTLAVNHFRNSGKRDQSNRYRPGPPRRYDDRGYRRYSEETPAGYIPSDVAGKHYLRTLGGTAIGSGLLTAAVLKHRARQKEDAGNRFLPPEMTEFHKGTAHTLKSIGRTAAVQTARKGAAYSGRHLAAGTLSSIPFLGMGYGAGKLENRVATQQQHQQQQER